MMRGLLLVGAVTVGLAVLASGETPPPDLPPALAASVAGQYFKLISGETTCSVRRDTSALAGLSRISLNSDCATAIPILASAESWRDNADGSISLIGAQGRSVLDFAPADGEGYESFGDNAPIAMLMPSN